MHRCSNLILNSGIDSLSKHITVSRKAAEYSSIQQLHKIFQFNGGKKTTFKLNIAAAIKLTIHLTIILEKALFLFCSCKLH